MNYFKIYSASVLLVICSLLISCDETTSKENISEKENPKLETDSISEYSIEPLEIEGLYHLTNSVGEGRLCIYQTESGAYLGYLSFHSGSTAHNMGELLGCLKKQADNWLLSGIGEAEQCEVGLTFQGDSLHLSFADKEGTCLFGTNTKPAGLYLKSNAQEDHLVLKNMFEENKECVIKVLGDNEDQKINYCNCEQYEKKESPYVQELKTIKSELSKYFTESIYDFYSEHYEWNWKEYWLSAVDSIIDILQQTPQQPLLFQREQKMDFTGNGTEEKLVYYMGYDNGFIRGLKLIRDNSTLGTLNFADDIVFENLHMIQGGFIDEAWAISDDGVMHNEIDALVGKLFPWMCLLESYDLGKSHPQLVENAVLQEILSNADIQENNETLNYIKSYKGRMIATVEWGFDGKFYTIWHKPSNRWLKFGVWNRNNMNELGEFEYL